MRRWVTLYAAALFFGISSFALAQALSDDEQTAWDQVSNNLSKQNLSLFLDTFPETLRLDQILELYPTAPDVSDQPIELAAVTNEPEVQAVTQVSATQTNQSELVSSGVQGQISDVLVRQGDQLLLVSENRPVDLLEVLNMSPQFGPPVDGLPDEIWKNGNCASCHTWNQAYLCEHGNLLSGFDKQALRRIDHPFGGVFKEYLVDWSKDGC